MPRCSHQNDNLITQILHRKCLWKLQCKAGTITFSFALFNNSAFSSLCRASFMLFRVIDLATSSPRYRNDSTCGNRGSLERCCLNCPRVRTCQQHVILHLQGCDEYARHTLLQLRAVQLKLYLHSWSQRKRTCKLRTRNSTCDEGLAWCSRAFTLNASRALHIR